MGTHSTMCCGQELHEDAPPFKKKCDECKEEFPLRAIFFPANWMHDGLVCGKCFDDYTQLEIEDLGLEEFIKRFAPEQQNTWIDSKITPPDHKADIEISYDGETVDNTVEWMKERTCIMAGIAGCHGYFGEGWGTNHESGTDYGLICDEPTHWRYRK